MAHVWFDMIGAGATVVNTEVPEVTIKLKFQRKPLRVYWVMSCNDANCGDDITRGIIRGRTEARDLKMYHEYWHSEGMPV